MSVIATFTYRQIQDTVHERIRRNTFQGIKKYVKKRKKRLKLWSEKKNKRGFLDKVIYAYVYKCITNEGYQRIWKRTKEWNHSSDKSLKHNMREVGKVMARWGNKQIKVGNSKSWNRSARNQTLGNQIKDANLLVDSSDFPRTGKTNRKIRKENFSHKLQGPGRRVTILRDFSAKVRKIFPHVTPKTYDGDFMKHNKGYLKEKFKNAVIVGDTHYLVCKKEFDKKNDGVSFHAPYPKPRSSKKNPKKKKKLGPRKTRYNSQIKAVRGAVERPFGQLKQKFDSLAKPFNGNDHDFDTMVSFAFGLHNKGF